jgi:hypothetical protein
MFPRKVDHQDPFLAVWRLVSSDRRIRHLAEWSASRTLGRFRSRSNATACHFPERTNSALGYMTPEEFEQMSEATSSDGTGASGGKPNAGLPPLAQALEIPSGFPHSHGSAAAFR